nr:DUF4143 domain-containing protein [Pseudonocardia sp. C8]
MRIAGRTAANRRDSLCESQTAGLRIARPLGGRPKLTITDTGLAARLLGGRLRTDPDLAGRLLETFVAGELRAQCEWSRTRPSLFHFRDRTGVEVDIVLESGDGHVVGVEIKAGATVRADDLRGLRLLEQRLGADFSAGIVLCTIPEARHLGGPIWALPFSALWHPNERAPRPRIDGDA